MVPFLAETAKSGKEFFTLTLAPLYAVRGLSEMVALIGKQLGAPSHLLEDSRSGELQSSTGGRNEPLLRPV